MRSDDPQYPGCPVTVAEAVDAGVVLRPARWDIADVLITIALTIALAVIGTAVMAALGTPLPVRIIAGALLSWIGLAGWPMLATWRRGNGPRIDLGLQLTWSGVRTGAVGGLIALAVAAIIAALLMRFVGAFNSAAGEAAAIIAADGSRVAMIAFAAMVLVGAPVVEEVAFRGLVFGVVRKRGLGTWWAIAISAVLFAAIHLELTRIPLLLGIGLVLGWVRARSRSTGPAIIAHGVVNAPGALFLLFGGVTP